MRHKSGYVDVDEEAESLVLKDMPELEELSPDDEVFRRTLLEELDSVSVFLRQRREDKGD